MPCPVSLSADRQTQTGGCRQAGSVGTTNLRTPVFTGVTSTIIYYKRPDSSEIAESINCDVSQELYMVGFVLDESVRLQQFNNI